MRILIRTSKWAIWSRRLGSLALPMTIVPVLLHREGLIESGDFTTIEAVSALIAAAALVTGLGAYARLWVTGDRGWGKATWGMLFALVCLAPFLYLGYEATRYPKVNEVATNFVDPLPLTSSVRVQPTSAALRTVIEARFPNVRTRSYPIDATQLFTIVGDLVDDRNWDVRMQRTPATPLDSGQIDAIAQTLLGWRNEVVIRVAGTAQGVTVDMRSVPLSDLHDFGESGKLIEEFLLALDQKVTLLLRDAPTAAATDAEDAPNATDAGTDEDGAAN
jgi:hypothetical protein